MVAERAHRRVKALPVYPTYSEVHRILAACPNERDQMLIKLLFATGGRVSEVLAARVGDITKHGIRLRNLKQDAEAEKHVFLPAAVLADLRAYVDGRLPQQHIIGRLADGEAITRQQAYNIVQNAARRAGVLKRRFGGDEPRPIWPHALRHANAIHLLDQGVAVNAVKEQLGHARLDSTMVYLQLTDPHRRRMLEGVTF